LPPKIDILVNEVGRQKNKVEGEVGLQPDTGIVSLEALAATEQVSK
jgi:hypothetical protein